MASAEFEFQQILKAYRRGLISEELFEQQMKELTGASVFTIPAGFNSDRENSHRGDQIIYVIEGSATARVSGKEQEVKAGDVITIPAGALHSLRTSGDALFGLTIFAPPE